MNSSISRQIMMAIYRRVGYIATSVKREVARDVVFLDGTLARKGVRLTEFNFGRAKSCQVAGLAIGQN